MMGHREALKSRYRAAALRGFTGCFLSPSRQREPEPRLAAPLNARPLTAAAAGGKAATGSAPTIARPVQGDHATIRQACAQRCSARIEDDMGAITLQFATCNDPGSWVSARFSADCARTSTPSWIMAGCLVRGLTAAIRPPDYEKWSRVERAVLQGARLLG